MSHKKKNINVCIESCLCLRFKSIKNQTNKNTTLYVESFIFIPTLEKFKNFHPHNRSRGIFVLQQTPTLKPSYP